MNPPLVSVIILNYNGKEFIERCLQSVLADSYPSKEIILVDNASPDGSIELARPYQDRLTIIENPKNYGFPKGCNEGIKEAKGEIIILLNIDTEVCEGWLQHLVQPMMDDPSVAITASKLLFPASKNIQFAGGKIHPNCLTSHDGYGLEDDGSFDVPKECDYATGASAAIRRSVLDELGGMDEGFPLYYEDVDLSVRARQKGYKVLYQPQSVVYHFETFGTRKFSFTYFYKFHRGRMRFLLKNFGLRYFLFTFFPAELKWYTQCDFKRQFPPLFAAYITQLPKSPYFWLKGFFYRLRLNTANIKIPSPSGRGLW